MPVGDVEVTERTGALIKEDSRSQTRVFETVGLEGFGVSKRTLVVSARRRENSRIRLSWPLQLSCMTRLFSHVRTDKISKPASPPFVQRW